MDINDERFARAMADRMDQLVKAASRETAPA
jgi:hypothetical protein